MKTKCYSVNHTLFPKENQIPEWALRGNKVSNGDRVDFRHAIKSQLIRKPFNLP